MTISLKALKEWLEEQLDTATEQGGNMIAGEYIDEIDPDGGEDNEVIAIFGDGTTFAFHITKWGS